MSVRTAVAALLPWLAAVGLPAQAQNPAQEPLTLILILDASGSMWAPVPIQDASRFAAAQRVVGDLADQLPEAIEVALIAYGHRRRDDCRDVETIVPLSPVDRGALKQSVGSLTPLGKTPLVGATEQALDILNRHDRTALVVLLTDGLETCGGDLVAIVRAAREQGLEFALEIVGFYVADEDAGQLEDAARAGCGHYFGAASADQLAAALEGAVARLGAVSTVRDDFNFAPFAGDSGKGGWRFGWDESGESDGPGDGGVIEIEVDRTCFDGACLNIEADAGAEGVSVARRVNLEGVDSTTLSFIYGHDGDAGSEIVLEVSGDGGRSWDLLETFRLNRVALGRKASYDLLPWAAADTRFRFRVTVAEWGDLGIDGLKLGWAIDDAPGVVGDTATVSDEFTFYGGNDGSRPWSGPWVENDDDHSGRGAIRLRASPQCRAGQCLKLRPNRGSAGTDIYRQADLTGSDSATLTYYFAHALLSGDEIVAEISGDGGRTYDVLETYTENTVKSGERSFDVSAFIASETRIRFRIAQSGLGKGMWVDDLQIEYADPGTCGG